MIPKKGGNKQKKNKEFQGNTVFLYFKEIQYINNQP